MFLPLICVDNGCYYTPFLSIVNSKYVIVKNLSRQPANQPINQPQNMQHIVFVYNCQPCQPNQPFSYRVFCQPALTRAFLIKNIIYDSEEGQRWQGLAVGSRNYSKSVYRKMVGLVGKVGKSRMNAVNVVGKVGDILPTYSEKSFLFPA